MPTVFLSLGQSCQQSAVLDILIVQFIKIWPASLPDLTFHSGLTLKPASTLWAFPAFHSKLEQPSEYKVFSNCLCNCLRWFRPLRCYKWFFSGLSWTAGRFFCCSSPRVRWSSSTRHPGSRWCWTNTWWPVWTGWCQPSSRSPQSLLGAPEGDDRETTQRNSQKEFPYSYTDWLHGWSIEKMSWLQRLTDSAVKVFFWVKLDSVWKENIYI